MDKRLVRQELSRGDDSKLIETSLTSMTLYNKVLCTGTGRHSWSKRSLPSPSYLFAPQSLGQSWAQLSSRAPNPPEAVFKAKSRRVGAARRPRPHPALPIS